LATIWGERKNIQILDLGKNVLIGEGQKKDLEKDVLWGEGKINKF